jgi:formylmethanofuran dehydrogenase subunit C
MRGGSIEVRGSAGNQVGAAYLGSRRGMAGGSIFIRGSAGDELGLLMRRGVIVVDGNCGEFAGASMIAGTIAVFGGTGPRLGAGMKRGTIIAARAPELPASFRLACEYRPSVLHLLNGEIARLGSASRFPTRPTRCFRGDLLTGGRGEVLVPA